MRYYDIKIVDPNSQQVFQTGTGLGFTKGVGGSTFTSYVSGQNVPSALQIEFDVPVAPLHIPQGMWYLRVWGIGLPMISQASQLAGMNVILSAGMQKGLPLANPAQAGILVTGRIFQAFGNWQGVNQTLDIVMFPPNLAPANKIAWNWKANTPFLQAVTSMLSQSFPTYKQDTSGLTTNLQQSSADQGTYGSLGELSVRIQQVTRSIGIKTQGPTYPGVFVKLESGTNTIYVYDNSKKLVQVAFQDLIGQPTWIDPSIVSFKTVLRTDILLGNLIQFPQGIIAPFALTDFAAAAARAPSSSKTAFQGKFKVIDVHHYANFRQPDAESWNTTFQVAFLAGSDIPEQNIDGSNNP